mgnify:CR=1 FL=1
MNQRSSRSALQEVAVGQQALFCCQCSTIDETGPTDSLNEYNCIGQVGSSPECVHKPYRRIRRWDCSSISAALTGGLFDNTSITALVGANENCNNCKCTHTIIEGSASLMGNASDTQ